ncbi:uncharacterized protein CELE_F55D12.1 [Caenorhabditis elegans]|uniref:Uncharacterized protein n=1 Tax=Caenorhabditis elegans TaxID=6239 RepID=Q20830_CAEEL|nr:Uncharacterized protein CELE_F55D12.1 [Caenorhabditis elegans]CAA99859.1 Uncharacterized protein CELE_F55D12.1 [Caenorhabditis elegans]|eukprot:NP_492178.1 Uncharacterized protein CELE_F55D12.1 [Caenorhabditis elegans]
MLDPRETFEKYERKSPHPPQNVISERREFVSCEYRREPLHQEQSRPSSILRNPLPQSHPYEERENARLACEYRRDQQSEHGQLACELRARPSTTITTFLPENTKRKMPLPIGWIVCIAVCIPILIVIIVFAAVWLQEVGII